MASTVCKKIVILPGNGCTNIRRSNWYGWFADEAKRLYPNVEVVCRDMPDPFVARESEWIPFIKDVIEVDPSTIVVGHSSGAVCAMRLLESTQLLGVILVASCHTDLGDENERASGYFDRDWEWDTIKSNAKSIIQFHSTDDPLIPVEEAQFIAEKLASDHVQYFELNERSHFFEPFPELLASLKSLLGNS